MKKLFLILVLALGINAFSQSKSDLINHFETYYLQMKAQGDVQGVINAMTHLNILSPNTARRDTLAYVYAAEGRYVEALNTVGVESNTADSDINVEVKAISLKALNQPKRALTHYEILFKRKPSPYLAYELADLKTQIQDFAGARESVTYGKANLKDDMKRAYYESQQPYQVSLKAAFLYMDALVTYNEDMENNADKALALLDEALKLEPNFNIAKLSRTALAAKNKPKE